MIKSELVTRLAARNPHLFQREVETVVNVILEEMTTALKDQNRVEMRGFGAFSVRKRDARTGRNPRTGESVDVSEKIVPFFRAGKELRTRINKDNADPAASEALDDEPLDEPPSEEDDAFPKAAE